jgi:hypothetical protein
MIVLSDLVVTSDTIFKNPNVATRLPELILSFRKQVEDVLNFFEYFATIDPSIEEKIDPLNTAAADFLQDIQEELDMLLSGHVFCVILEKFHELVTQVLKIINSSTLQCHFVKNSNLQTVMKQ